MTHNSRWTWASDVRLTGRLGLGIAGADRETQHLRLLKHTTEAFGPHGRDEVDPTDLSNG